MNEFSKILNAPFPRPQSFKQFIVWVLSIGIGCSIFILLYNPFGIADQTGDLYVDLIIFSLGFVFAFSIILMEWVIPMIIPRPFNNWTIGKALIWYTLIIVVSGGVNFLYKSYLGGFQDFTITEFFFVLLRTIVISFTVVFAVIGIFQLFNKNRISLLTSGEDFQITSSDGRKITISLSQILYITSDDNYVDIHWLNNESRDKTILRSSLKNMEEQLVTSISPIRRCHRQFLININQFKIEKVTSRSMTLLLKNYTDQIPVSAQFVTDIKKELFTDP